MAVDSAPTPARRRPGRPSSTIRASAAIIYQIVVGRRWSASCVWIVSNTAVNLAAQNKTTGFDFLGRRPASTSASRCSRSTAPRPTAGLPRRPDQHAARRRHRHRLRDDPRLHDRHRAAVEQLHHLAARRRSTSRPSATSRCCCSSFFWYFAVLKAMPARATRRAAGRHLHQQARPVRAAADLRRRLRVRGARLRHRRRGWRSPAIALGAGAAGGDRPAVPGTSSSAPG